MVTSSLTNIAQDAEARFGELTAEQLNWKPDLGRWSVAQCFDHLITTQTFYFPVLDRLASGSYSPTAWERYSPFSGLFGRMLIRALDPKNAMKTKTASKSMPSGSDLGGEIIRRFVAHQDELVGRIRALPAGLATNSVIITSPLSGFVTYSLDDSFAMIVVHARRHVGQAERVTAMPGFPS